MRPRDRDPTPNPLLHDFVQGDQVSQLVQVGQVSILHFLNSLFLPIQFVPHKQSRILIVTPPPQLWSHGVQFSHAAQPEQESKVVDGQSAISTLEPGQYFERSSLGVLESVYMHSRFLCFFGMVISVLYKTDWLLRVRHSLLHFGLQLSHSSQVDQLGHVKISHGELSDGLVAYSASQSKVV